MYWFGISLIAIFVPFSAGVIVCPTFMDYVFYKINNRCYNNPDGEAEKPSIIIQRHGYNSKTYKITTADGYILSIECLHKTIEKRTPIIIGTGIYLNSFASINTGNKSLAFFLADQGYQVWLINWRGTRFSRKHKYLSPKSREYWNTGFDEMAKFDLKSVMEKVFEESKTKAIYVAYSMGTTIGLIANIKEQKTAEKTLKGMVQMAPIGTFNYSKSILKYFHQLWPLIIKPLIYYFGHGEIHLYRNNGTICAPNPLGIVLCGLVRTPIFGKQFKFWDAWTYPVRALLNHDSISMKTIAHYHQIMNRKSFSEFSYGTMRNLLEYHSTKAPLYDLKKVTLPQSLLVGKTDILATVKDSKNLYDLIPESSKCGYLIVEDYGHLDFISANNVENALYGMVLNSIDKIDNGKCI